MKKISSNKLGRLVIKKRKKLNLTQSELAEKIDSNKQLINRIENGKFIPSINQLETLLGQLNIDFNDITENEVEENIFSAIREKATSKEEKEGIDKMISMILCLKKHKNIRNALNKE